MTADKPQHPTVSVVMPTYNHAAYIGEAIQSVVDQTYRDFELIVVDNYSQDDTETIVRAFNDPRFAYLKFSNNGVIAASRNTALKKARGRFIAFLDSDDTWTADKLETQLKHVEANPNVALVCGSLVTRRDNEPFDTAAGPPAASLSGFSYNWLLDCNFIFCSSVMVRREVLDEVGLFDEDPGMISSEDWDLWLRIARKHRLTLLPKQLGSYRVHGSNVSADSRKIRRIECVLRKHLAKRWITAGRLDRSMAYFSFSLGWLCIDQAPGDARRMFKDALKFAGGSPKISLVASLGLVLSFFPPVCRFIKRRSVGRFVNRVVNLRGPANDSERRQGTRRVSVPPMLRGKSRGRPKILHFIPTMGGGGAERQLTHLAPMLSDLGWETHVAWVFDGPNEARLKSEKVTLHRLSVHNPHDPRILRELISLGREVRPDILQSWLLMMDVWTGVTSRMLSIPWILSERSSERMYLNNPKYLLRNMVARGATAIVSNSHLGDEYWRGRVPSRVPRYVIPNGIPFDEIRSCEPHEVAGGQKLVLYAGRFGWEKNLDVLLEALRRVVAEHDVSVVMCGAGEGLPAAKEKLAGWGISERFHLPGYVADLYAWMKRADVLVSVSHVEGHPNVILEAMAGECPTVVSDIPAHRAILDGHETLFVDNTRPEEVSAAIAEALSDPGASRRRAEAARRHAARWTLESAAKRYYEVYRNIIES